MNIADESEWSAELVGAVEAVEVLLESLDVSPFTRLELAVVLVHRVIEETESPTTVKYAVIEWIKDLAGGEGDLALIRKKGRRPRQ